MRSADCLHGIQGIVDRGNQAQDVLGVDGGDQGARQQVGHLVDDKIALVLDLGDLGDLFLDVFQVIDSGF